jgi:PPOX class probable F420-dependent enzyme
MRLETAAARAAFRSAEVARLATVGTDGGPHLVPIVFVHADPDVLYTAIDDKPKSTLALRRLTNIAANPRVCVLADHYEADWSRLWWVRADGIAGVHDPASAEANRARALLAERYHAYNEAEPRGPVIGVRIERWTGWSSGDLPST